jgi:hypothetical protein
MLLLRARERLERWKLLQEDEMLWWMIKNQVSVGH